MLIRRTRQMAPSAPPKQPRSWRLLIAGSSGSCWGPKTLPQRPSVRELRAGGPSLSPSPRLTSRYTMMHTVSAPWCPETSADGGHHVVTSSCVMMTLMHA